MFSFFRFIFYKNMYIDKNKFSFWYKNNLEKIVLVFIILVIFTLTVAYIPYLNVLFPPSFGFLIVFLTWYLLFSPTISILAFLGIVVLGIALVSTFLELVFLAETMGEFLYILLVLIAINFFKDFLRERNT